MSKRCQGGCNRDLDEYYKLRNGTIMCYDCWVRAKAQQHALAMQNNMMYQDDIRRYNEKKALMKNLSAEASHLRYTGKYDDYIYEDGSLRNPNERPPNYERIHSLENQYSNLVEETAYFPRQRTLPDASYLENPTFYSKEK
jgi:hypothetical protein